MNYDNISKAIKELKTMSNRFIHNSEEETEIAYEIDALRHKLEDIEQRQFEEEEA